mgnify:CR=1 FL=1
MVGAVPACMSVAKLEWSQLQVNLLKEGDSVFPADWSLVVDGGSSPGLVKRRGGITKLL